MKCYDVTARNAATWSAIADEFVPMEHDYPDPDRYYATMSVQESSDHRLLRWHQGGARTSCRTRPLIRRSECADFYWVVAPERGSYTVEYEDALTHVVPGMGAVTAVDAVCSIRIPQSTAYVLQLARDEIDAHTGSFEAHTSTLDFSRGLGRITRTLLRSTHAEQAELSTAEFDAVCHRIGELFCLQLLGDAQPPQREHEQVIDQVRRYVRANVGRGDIRLPAVASALGWSPRTIRSVLHRSGLNFRDIRREETLRSARALLQNPAFASVPISDLAARSGLSTTWFSTAFRDFYGESPHAYRQRSYNEVATNRTAHQPDTDKPGTA